ncbi:coproporphyrinogen III oxidase, partial [bacterium]|nr:coproporphyrinogen III oxidase [bacterium]
AGFQKTNLDLMFAIPNQTIEQWESDIREASRLGPSHLSTYCLTFEEDTALYVKLSQGKVSIDEDKELRFYERGWELLAELGYEQYEISNFAKADSECRHNVNTWKMHEWIGCGPSAASQYAGERYQRPANLDEWCVSLDSGESPKFEQVRLGNEILFTDAVIFGLRMNRGVDLDEISERFPCNSVRDNVESMLRHFAGEGLLLLEGSKCRLTHSGRLLCDRIGSELLEC